MNKRRIKIIALVTLLIVVLSTLVYSVEVMPVLFNEPEQFTLIVNGETFMDSKYAPTPYIESGETMVPLRAVAENLGFSVAWNSETNAIELVKPDEKAELTIGSKTAKSVEGTAAVLTIEPEVIEGVTFVPLNFFDIALNAEVTQDDLVITIKGAFDMRIEETSSAIKSLVADVPENYMVDNFYEYSHTVVQSPVADNGRALEITGNNHSDDMFMGFYRQITGLEPNTEYIFKVNADVGTNVAGGMMGIGGSPGSSVYIKAGFVEERPTTVVEADGYIRLSNVDKGNQSQDGIDMKVLSNIEKTSGDESDDYEYKNIFGYFIVTTDEDGSIYFLMGTDSGFEGLSRIYYDNIFLTIKEATDYNLSTIQEPNFYIRSDYSELESGVTIMIPTVMGMQNDKRQIELNEIIADKVDAIMADSRLESMMFDYSLKDNGWLSIVFDCSHSKNGFSVPYYFVLNIDIKTMVLLDNDDLISQNEEVYNKVKNIMADGVFYSDMSPTMVVSNMKICYKDGDYGIIIPVDYYSQGLGMVIFSEEEVGDYFQY